MKEVIHGKKTQNINFFSRTILLCLVINFAVSQSQPKQTTQPTPPTNAQAAENLSTTGCRKDILQSYSLSGIDNPIIERIEMCPSIVRSCCTKQDQLTIFNNFVQGGELQRIVDYYTTVKGVYEETLESFAKIHDFAKAVKANSVKKISNCKLLAERFLAYEITEIKPLIEKNLQKLVDYFTTSYSSFYCTICNFDNHKYIDLQDKKVFFSSKFCYTTIKETLHALLLFHVDIVKLANLGSKLVGSCDYSGAFNADANIPKNVIFNVRKVIVDDLEGCRSKRNRREWFSFCKDVCRKFQINSFPSFFQPNIRKCGAFISFVSIKISQHAKKQGEKTIYGPLSSISSETPKLRILQEKGSSSKSSGSKNSKGKKTKRKSSKKKRDPIFLTGLTAKCDLTKFKSVFDTEKGLSMYQEHLINEETYNHVKTILDLLQIPKDPFAQKDNPSGLSSNYDADNYVSKNKREK